MFKLVSLFSGCGGGDLGFRGGFHFNGKYYSKNLVKCVFANDINEKALQTFSMNIPCNNIVCKDIKEIDKKNIPDCDIVIGGFPCQSFSTVNPTKNPFDSRGNLYKEMAEVLKAKQPKVFVAENVKGLLTLKKGMIFDLVKTAFENCGYNTYCKLLTATDYGVPQLRQRVIIVGVRKDIPLEYSFPSGITKNNPPVLGEVIDNLELNNKKYYFSKRAVEGMRNAKPNMKRGLAQDLKKPCLTITAHLAKVSLNSRDPVLLVNPETSLYRRFTPREAARIQSFPDNFSFFGSEADAYRQIGNAIPPVMFWYIAKSICKFLKSTEK